MKRSVLQPLFRLAVSVALVAFLLTRLSFGEIREALADPRWGWLIASAAVYLLSAAGGALQWGWILRLAGIATPAVEIGRLYFVGLFFNNFLPANVGGDAVKIIDLGRQEHRSFSVFCGTLLDRILGLCALTVLALAAAAIAALRGSGLPTMVPLFAAGVIWVGALAVLLSRRLSAFCARTLRLVRMPAIADRVDQFAEEFKIFRTRLRRLAGVFCLACGVQSLRILTHILAALGLGLTLGGDQILLFFVLVPLLGVLIALPISINGIGVREVLSTRFFVTAGVVAVAADAVAVEFSAYLVQVAVSLLGGILFFSGRLRRAEPAA